LQTHALFRRAEFFFMPRSAPLHARAKLAAETSDAAVKRRALAERHSALMGEAEARAAAQLTDELARCGAPVADCDAVAHVDWVAQDVDWSAAARPYWLLHALPWGPELMEVGRALLESVVSVARSQLNALIKADFLALDCRGGIEVDSD
jgi:hypothetical protein